MTLPINQIICGDCLDIMLDLPDGCADMILADVPYGTTACKWDSIIHLEPMWKQLKRIIKPNGAIVMTASQPFTTALIASNMKMFKYCWVWEKSNPANIACSKIQPLKYHEDIVVFYSNQPTFNKQMIERDKLGRLRLQNKNNPIRFSGSAIQNKKGEKRDYDINRYDENLKNPSTVLKIKSERGKIHSTQKPVALMEYLIKTYTNEGELVLDFACGSGTTCKAAQNLGRRYIGIEISPEYCQIARDRLRAVDTGVPVKEARAGQQALFV